MLNLFDTGDVMCIEFDSEGGEVKVDAVEPNEFAMEVVEDASDCSLKSNVEVEPRGLFRFLISQLLDDQTVSDSAYFEDGCLFKALDSERIRLSSRSALEEIVLCRISLWNFEVHEPQHFSP